MSVTVGKIDAFMSSFAKEEDSESWDNDGIMLCGNIDEKVTKILICLEINRKTVNDAVSFGAQLIITHHPFIFRPLKNVCGGDYEIFDTLIKNGISVLSYHTRLDAAQGGVNDVLCEKLSLSDPKPFGGESGNIGRYGNLPNEMTEDELAQHIKNALGCGIMRTASCMGERKIKTVAVVGGGGKDFVHDAAGVADAYVTSDLSHNSFIDAQSLGILLFDAGHYYTENPVCKKIKDMLKREFDGLCICVSDSICPFILK